MRKGEHDGRGGELCHTVDRRGDSVVIRPMGARHLLVECVVLDRYTAAEIAPSQARRLAAALLRWADAKGEPDAE